MLRWKSTLALSVFAILAGTACAKAPPKAAMDTMPVANYAPAPKAPWPGSVSPEPVDTTASESLRVVHVSRLASEDPYDPVWKQAGYVDIPVFPQNLTMPQLEKAVIAGVRVQGLTDGTTIAFRLSWDDPTPDGNVDAGRFTDGVATQFPLDKGAAPMMGHRETGRVQILHWTALWQKDIDVGFQDVEDLHPNVWSDLYWFAQGEFPYTVPGAFSDSRSRAWFIANQAGNPMAVFSRTQPVEELVAEGWGTLTAQKEAAAKGRGVWTGGRWAVVISRPLKTDDPLDVVFEPGSSSMLAVAVWDGGSNQVGGRKQWSNWTVFEIEP